MIDKIADGIRSESYNATNDADSKIAAGDDCSERMFQGRVTECSSPARVLGEDLLNDFRQSKRASVNPTSLQDSESTVPINKRHIVVGAKGNIWRTQLASVGDAGSPSKVPYNSAMNAFVVSGSVNALNIYCGMEGHPVLFFIDSEKGDMRSVNFDPLKDLQLTETTSDQQNEERCLSAKRAWQYGARLRS